MAGVLLLTFVQVDTREVWLMMLLVST